MQSIKELNDGELKKKGFYLALVPRNLFVKDRCAGGDGGGDAMAKIIKQMNWQYHSGTMPTMPKDPKALCAVCLTEAEWALIVDACEVYHDINFRMHEQEIMEDLKHCIIAIGDAQRDGRL